MGVVDIKFNSDGNRNKYLQIVSNILFLENLSPDFPYIYL